MFSKNNTNNYMGRNTIVLFSRIILTYANGMNWYQLI